MVYTVVGGNYEMTKKEELIKKINNAFQDVKLEDGIGLWEAQGHDDRLTANECIVLRKKDEKNDWNNIPIIDLYKCSSSLSFFDSKGLRFHMPIFLLFALDLFEKVEDELHRKGLVDSCLAPDIEFHLLSGLRDLNAKDEMGKRMRKYDNERFSLFNISQIECIIGFLKFRMNEMEEYYNSTYAKELGTSPSAVKYDKYYFQLEKGIEYWKEKATTANTE